MQTIRVSTRAEWRAWLSQNHNKVDEGIWLVFWKKKTANPCELLWKIKSVDPSLSMSNRYGFEGNPITIGIPFDMGTSKWW